jgi:hypothetical protein
MKKIGVLILFLHFIHQVNAQYQVRDSALFNPHVSISWGFQSPAGDMADRFGNNGSVGIGFHIKSKTNWYYGLQGTYMYGRTVNEPGLLSNLYTDRGEILDNQGQIATIFIQQRGYTVTADFGRLFNVLSPNPNSGILVYGGVGFMQHKIRIEHQENEIRFLDGEYEKGYDRLTNGFTAYQFAGYSLMSNNKLINFFAGVECYQGFTQSRRNLNFDTMERDTKQRRDILFGFRAGWVLNLYVREPDEFYYD